MTQKIQFYVDGWHGGCLSEVSMIYFLKFIFSEKATKFCEISTNYLTGDFTVLYYLDSGIKVSPIFINAGLFPGPSALLKGPKFIKSITKSKKYGKEYSNA